jgi:Flp pilus assembly protein TadG
MSAFATLRRRLARGERGQAVLETALVLPILLTLVFGIMEMGLYMYDYVQAANCAREAARRAAVRAPDAGSPPPYCVSAKLQPALTYADPTNKRAGTDVTATVNSTHQWLVINNFVPGLGASQPLHAAVTMRLEPEKVS